MEDCALNSLFGGGCSTTPAVEKGPAPTKVVPFKIPMGIVDHVMVNRYAGDETVHIPVLTCFILQNYVLYLSLQV